MVEKLAFQFSLYVKSKAPDSRSVEVINYGMVIILNLLFTIVISFIIAILMGIFTKTLIVFLAFVLFRQFSGGFHLKSCDACVVVSTILLLAIPIIDTHIKLGLYSDLFTILAVLNFAPLTKKFTYQNDSKRYIAYKLVVLFMVLLNTILIESSLISITFFVASISLVLAYIADLIETRKHR